MRSVSFSSDQKSPEPYGARMYLMIVVICNTAFITGSTDLSPLVKRLLNLKKSPPYTR